MSTSTKKFWKTRYTQKGAKDRRRHKKGYSITHTTEYKTHKRHVSYLKGPQPSPDTTQTTKTPTLHKTSQKPTLPQSSLHNTSQGKSDSDSSSSGSFEIGGDGSGDWENFEKIFGKFPTLCTAKLIKVTQSHRKAPTPQKALIKVLRRHKRSPSCPPKLELKAPPKNPAPPLEPKQKQIAILAHLKNPTNRKKIIIIIFLLLLLVVVEYTSNKSKKPL